MRKLRFVALALACALLFSGCSLVSIDEDRVANQVVAIVNGEKIYNYEVDVDYQKKYVDYMVSAYYGMSPEQMDQETLQGMYDDQIQSVLESLVLNKLLLKKAGELGITLTEEELAENREEADNYFKDEKDSIIEEVLATPTPSATETPSATPMPTATPVPTATATPETTGAESATAESAAAPTSTPTPSPTATPEPTPAPSLNAAQQAQVDEQYQLFIDDFGYTPDTYYEYLNESDLITKVQEYIYDQAAVSDEAALEWYNSMLEQQKAATEEDPSVFETYVQENKIITYVPEDTVAVKQVFLQFDDAELVEEAKALYENGEEELAFELLQAQIDALMPAAEAAQERLLAGENIDDLIAEMGDDPGMDNSPGKRYGYLVESRTTAYVQEFTDAALGLFDVGAVSEPTVSYMGIHVLQSIDTYEAGEVPFEQIKESIKTAMLPDAQQAKYQEMTELWLSEADVTYYYDRLG